MGILDDSLITKLKLHLCHLEEREISSLVNKFFLFNPAPIF
jgi:hypothetical protein